MKIVVALILSVLVAFGFYVTSRSMPTADCKDGKVSYSKHKSGTCARHGGVAKWR